MRQIWNTTTPDEVARIKGFRERPQNNPERSTSLCPPRSQNIGVPTPTSRQTTGGSIRHVETDTRGSQSRHQSDVHRQVIGYVQSVDNALLRAIPKYVAPIHKNVIYSRCSPKTARLESGVCPDFITTTLLGSIVRVL